MAKQPANDQDAALEQELNRLKQDYERLKMEKVRTEQNLANVEGQLRELEAAAVSEYGTADPAALEELLARQRADNARLVEEYRSHIQGVRAGLEAVENATDVRGEA